MRNTLWNYANFIVITIKRRNIDAGQSCKLGMHFSQHLLCTSPGILTLWWGVRLSAKDFTIHMRVFPAQLLEVQANVVRPFGPQNVQKTT